MKSATTSNGLTTWLVLASGVAMMVITVVTLCTLADWLQARNGHFNTHRHIDRGGYALHLD